MLQPSYSDATLVLIGHGSTLDEGSAASTYQQAAMLRERGLFAEVREAFWKVEPKLDKVAEAISSPRVFFVPMFISDGYFTHEVLPRALGFSNLGEKQFVRMKQLGMQTLHYCGPAGTHPAITEVVLARARAVVADHPFPRAPQPSDCALVLIGHGTLRNENSRKAVEDQVAHIRTLGIYRETHGVFLEEEPLVSACYALTELKNLVVVPFFMSDGLHSHQQIPVMLGEPEKVVQQRISQSQATWRNPTERKGKRVWYSSCVGTDPRVAELILERVAEVLRIGP